jgi:hypothetical protein
MGEGMSVKSKWERWEGRDGRGGVEVGEWEWGGEVERNRGREMRCYGEGSLKWKRGR